MSRYRVAALRWLGIGRNGTGGAPSLSTSPNSWRSLAAVRHPCRTMDPGQFEQQHVELLADQR
ncbi:MAG TPA: hypothetical protein VK749_02540, partial [Xanthobacteraceae bacterium]|nr:hypothetical protein [Xanthobacteraceae bacterium]